MLLNKVLRVVNVLIGMAVALVLGAGWWFAWRPLPETSGDIQAPVRAEGTIARDARGVPYIQAGSIEEAAFLQGYATAQDRLWQMDATRRLAAGELSEVIGPATLESDRESRRLRLRRIAEEQYAGVPESDRLLMAAYARGVNHYIETHRERLPLEFTLLRYDPRPWSVVDSILVGLQMYRTLTTSWKEELAMASMLEGGDREKVGYLFPARTGMEVQPGSNAWVISGKHSATGKPILANDPHLEFSVPSTWHMVEMQAPGLHVAGVALPGVPFVIIGHNEHIAWGVTNLHFDVQDLYLERLDPQSGRYEYEGKVEQARLEREVIAVRGQRPLEMGLWVTRHGPIFASEKNKHYALRWTAAESQFEFPFAQLNQAKNWEEFRAALRRFPGPGQNFVYADTEGNIGYQATGRLPIRKTYPGNVPVDGLAGSYEWEGYIPFDDLPSAYNPASGIIVSANQNPFPAKYSFPVNGSFGSFYRAKQIRDLLRSREGWRPEDMLAVQKDVYSPFSHFLGKLAVAAYDRKKPAKPSLAEAVDVLRNWNGQAEKGTAAPLLAALFYQHLRSEIAEKASPGKGSAYQFNMASSVVERLLRERPAGWFSDYDKFILDSFSDAVDEGKRMQGDRIAKWDYGAYNRVALTHPVVSKLPWVGRYFDVGVVEMSGSPTTVKQTTRRLGPSMRFVADLSNWDRTLQNITTGESGHVLSSHYKDQWDAYYAGKSFPFTFSGVDAKATLSVVPQ